jgi:hypothetical protein
MDEVQIPGNPKYNEKLVLKRKGYRRVLFSILLFIDVIFIVFAHVILGNEHTC